MSLEDLNRPLVADREIDMTTFATLVSSMLSPLSILPALMVIAMSLIAMTLVLARVLERGSFCPEKAELMAEICQLKAAIAAKEKEIAMMSKPVRPFQVSEEVREQLDLLPPATDRRSAMDVLKVMLQEYEPVESPLDLPKVLWDGTATMKIVT